MTSMVHTSHLARVVQGSTLKLYCFALVGLSPTIDICYDFSHPSKLNEFDPNFFCSEIKIFLGFAGEKV
jgi:hypothetical protein